MQANNIAVFGCSGSLGNAFVRYLAVQYPKAVIHTFSRTQQEFESTNVLSHSLDFQDEGAIEQASSQLLSSSNLILLSLLRACYMMRL